jgi:hypothetical protein
MTTILQWLVAGTSVPRNRFGLVLFHPQAVGIAPAEEALVKGIAALRTGAPVIGREGLIRPIRLAGTA